MLEFLSPVSKFLRNHAHLTSENKLGAVIDFYTSKIDLSEYHIAVLGVQEERNAIENEGCSAGVNEIRKEFYDLYPGHWALRIIDLGNIQQGATVEDTYFALSEVVSTCLKHQVIPIILGGSQDLTYAQYRAYEAMEQLVNIVAVDKSFDIGNPENPIDSTSFLNKVILRKPNILFNFTNIGYQSYFVDPQEVDLLDRMHFDAYRLGVFKANIEWVEPLVRDADILSFDMSSLQSHMAPGCGRVTPNGLSGEEACAIMRYAGLSDKMTSVGLYEYNPFFDRNNQSAKLIAQMMWYFIEGVSLRAADYPIGSKSKYQKFIVPVEHGEDLVFLKSHKSGRWWVEVPSLNVDPKKKRHSMVPCSYEDYKDAAAQEIPERWWRTSRKMV